MKLKVRHEKLRTREADPEIKRPRSCTFFKCTANAASLLPASNQGIARRFSARSVHFAARLFLERF